MLGGCGSPTKRELAARSEHVKTTAELESALGKPDKYELADMPVLGKVETFTYKASDGEMIFTSHNGKIRMKLSDGQQGRDRE